MHENLSTIPNWLCNLWIEHMYSLEFELHDIHVYTKIDLDALLYNQCNTLEITIKFSIHTN